MNARVFNFFILFLLAVGVCFLSRHIQASWAAGTLQQSQDPLYELIGSAKEAVGDTFYMKADEYFHGGVREKFEEKRSAAAHDGFVEAEEQHHYGEKETPEDWIERVNQQIGFTKHYHLKGEEIKEMLPLLAGAVDMNPHNLEAVLTTAYWLSSQLGQADEALRVLEEGLKNNPDSWALHKQAADIFYRKKSDPATAKVYYEKALLLLEQTPDFEKKDLDVQEIRRMLAKCS